MIRARIHPPARRSTTSAGRDAWLLSCDGPGRRGPQILGRPGNRMSQLTRRAKRPVRIAKQLARQEHAIRATRPYELVGLGGRRNEADGGGRDAGLAADTLG